MDTGSKTIARIGAILAALENGPEEGLSAGQVAEATGFDKATAYRALVSLVGTGLVERDAEARKFRLGIYLFKLGAAVARRFSVLSHARKIMTEIAAETGDTVYLSVRNRFEAVCIDCATGSYPIKAQTLSVGEGVPLGMSAAGVALLAAMTDAEVRHAVQYNAAAIGRFHSVRPEQIYEHVETARQRGYACYTGQIVAGMGAVACAIRDAQDRGLAAVSVTGLLSRLSEARVEEIVGLLRRRCAEVEDRARLLGDQTHRTGGRAATADLSHHFASSPPSAAAR